MKSHFFILLLALVLFRTNITLSDGKPYEGKSKENSQDFSGESLFTGDVAFSVPLASLGGINVALNYNSNIHKLIRLDNSELQAGWVGLGWSLTLGSIKADINGTQDISDDRYFFESIEGTSELINQSGNSFILKEYKYWKIERQVDNNNLIGWIVTKDDGTILRYGNYNKTNGNFLFDRSNTKATRFLLGWDGIITNALNIKYSDAEFIAYQWDISDIEDIYQNHTTINYYQEIDYLYCQYYSTLPQQFTRESYPESIIDPMGNKIEFILGELTTDEYPENAGMVGVDKPLQALFETHFLDNITVKNKNDDVVKEIDLSYDIEDVLSLGYTKRYLKSFTIKDANGIAQPSTSFQYYAVAIPPSQTEALEFEYYGALEKIEYSNGGTVEYQYSAQPIENVTLHQDLFFNETVKPKLPSYEYGLAGIDFYAVKMSDNTLRVYRWGTEGWYLDNTFPASGIVNEYWVSNDYIVFNQDVTMKVVKRKGNGWTNQYSVSANYGNSPGSLAVMDMESNFFVLRHNVVVHQQGFIYYGTEDVSVVKFEDDAWSTQFISTINLGQLPNGYQPEKEVEAVCGNGFFVIKAASGIFDEYASLCKIVIDGQSQWIIQATIPITNLPNDMWFALAGGKDYFITWRVHESNPNLKSIFVWNWPFSIDDYSVSTNIDASRGIFPGENFYVTVGENNIEIRTYNGDGRYNAYYSYTDLDDLLSVPINSIQNATVSPGKNNVVVGWVEGSGSTYVGKIALAKFEDGEWISAGLVDTYNNLNQPSMVRVFNNPENIFAEVYHWAIETKLLSYSKNESSWNRIELVDVDQLGGSFPISSLSMAGANFVADVIQPGTVNDEKWINSRMKAYDQNVDLLYQAHPYDYPITLKTITDAMGNIYITTFTYENGIYDETLNFAKYNKVTVKPPGNNGKTITYFYNDLGPAQTEEFVDVPNYKELDGIPYIVKVFSQGDPINPVSKITNTWDVFNIDADKGVYYKRLMIMQSLNDGVTKTTYYDYNNTNGKISWITESVQVPSNLSGLRDRRTEIIYAFQQYPEMQTVNMLNQVYENKVYSIGTNPTSVLIAQDRTEYDINGYPYRTLVYGGTNWIVTNTITRRNSIGSIIEIQDIEGKFISTKYSTDILPYAQITNANFEETAVADFEDGTVGEWDDWIISGEFSNKNHTGIKSYKLRAGFEDQITKQFNSADLDINGKYIASGWVITSSTNPKILISIFINGGFQFAGVSASGTGEWEYLECVIDLSSYPGFEYITHSIVNSDGQGNFYESYWDDLKFYPVDAFITTTTYDPLTLQVTSKTNSNNVTTHHEYDSFGSLIEIRNDDGLVISESNYFSSVDKYGSLNPSYPNSVTQKTFPHGNPVKNGSFEMVVAGSQPKDWTWSPNACAPIVVKDAHTGTYSMKITANANDAYVHNYLYSQNYLKKNTTYRYSFWAKRQGSGTSSVDVYLMKLDGTTYKIWNYANLTVSGTEWQHYTGTITLSGSSEWDNSNYLSVIRLDVNQSGHIVYFDDVQLEEGSTLHLPMNSVTYSDGLGRSIQSQSLEAQNNFISHIEYDEKGLPWRSWRTYSQSTDGEYDPDFSLHCSNEYGVANPYTEKVYYDEPLNRVYKSYPLANSYSGEEIEYVYGKKTIPGGSTTEYNYTDTKSKIGTANGLVIDRQYYDKLGRVIRTASFLDGQSEEHISETLYNFLNEPVVVTDPNGFITSYDYDFLGRMIIKDTPDADPVEYIYDKAGRLRLMVEGEGLAANPDKILYWKYDVNGRVLEKGYIEMNWDRNILQGLVDGDRSWPPTPPQTWSKIYYYDGDGSIPNKRGRLEKILLKTDNGVNEEYFSYDKYGNVISQSTKAINFNNLLHITEYEFDDIGRVTKIKYPMPLNNLVLENMTLGGGSPIYYDGTNITAGPSLTISNGANVTFEAANQIKLMPGFTASNGSEFRAFIGSFPGQEIQTEVIYTYNQRGMVKSIGVPEDDNLFADYTYKSDGAIDQEILNNNPASNPITTSFTYDSKGRLSLLMDSYMRFYEALSYTYGSDEYFGNIATAQYNFSWSGAPQSYSVSYVYDNFGRLITADNSLGSQWDIGVGVNNHTTYDQNGNITKMVVGSTTKDYIYYENSNKVKNTNNSSNMDYDYDLNGNLESNVPKNLTLTYDPFTQMTTQISSPTATVNFEYNSSNERLLKKDATSNSSVLYLRGMNEYPLYEKQNAEGDGSFDKIYIYGPTGLIAVKRLEGTYFVLKDHLGSTRVIFDGATGEPVSYYDFIAYGNTMRVGGGVGLKYQFTGQEFDDEFGLHNFRARFYDSDIAMFYAVDPVGQGFSPYGYCGDNPVIFVDKDGRVWWIGALIGAYVGGLISNGFEPLPWKWENKAATWHGIMFGALMGGVAGASPDLTTTFGAYLYEGGQTIASIGVTLSEFGTEAMYLSAASLNLYGAYIAYQRIKSSSIHLLPDGGIGSDDLIYDETERNLITFGYAVNVVPGVGANAEAGVVWDLNTGEYLPYFKWGYAGGINISGGPQVSYMRYSFKEFYGSGSQNAVPYNSEEFGFNTFYGGASFYWDPNPEGDIFGGSFSPNYLSFGAGASNNYTNQVFMLTQSDWNKMIQEYYYLFLLR